MKTKFSCAKLTVTSKTQNKSLSC